MNEKQIKRFFKAYGYPVSVRLNNDGEIVQVGNKQFDICLEKDCYWFDGFSVDGSELIYHFEADQDCLYSMIIAGWSLTRDIYEIEQEKLQTLMNKI